MQQDMVGQLEKLQPKTTKAGRSRSDIAKGAIRRGKSGERYFADILSEISQQKWIRIPRSGAGCGASNRKQAALLSKTQGTLLLGDILQPDNLKYRFIFESKAYTNLDIWNMLQPKLSKTICSWIDELMYDIETDIMFLKSKHILGFLCIKNINKGNWIVVNKGNLSTQLSEYSLMFPFLSFSHNITQLLKEHGWNNEFYLIDFRSFIESNKMHLFFPEKLLITPTQSPESTVIYNDEVQNI